ncbi:MAG: 4Fe-4S binding protein [Bacteroidales bacterium]|nr:4Fe-4S binding protein [Bacteroidales bacterium]
MIIYFSGTGNSRYVAHEVGRHLSEKVIGLRDKNETILSKNLKEDKSQRIILVFPVYAWGVPPNVIELIANLIPVLSQLSIWPSIYAVMTCGDETGMAPEILIRNASRYGIVMTGIYSIIMPNNYVLLPGFKVDAKNVEMAKLSGAPARIKEIADGILSNNIGVIDVTRGSWPRLKTRLVYPLFKRWGVFPKKWKSDDKCIGCGKCEAVCPSRNIKLENNRPIWGEDCTSCVACFHICPVRAIDYGKLTEGKSQYLCPLK